MVKESEHSEYREQELLLLIAKDDKQAYRLLFEKYWGQVYGAGLYLTKSPEQARDLAQDIFLKVWDMRLKLPEVRNFGAYLHTITRNLIHDHLRTRVFRESNKEFLLQYFTVAESSPHEQMERKQLGHVLDQAIYALPPKLRQVFLLSRYEGLSHEEIGKRLAISPLSSKTYMTRALAALRKTIGEGLRIFFYF